MAYTGYDLVAAAVSGGIVAVFLQEVVHWWRKPSLSIEYENKSAYQPKTPIRWPNDFLNNPGAETSEYEATFIRVKVINTGRSTAKNCRAFITAVRRQNTDGSSDMIVEQDAIALSWSMSPHLWSPIEIPVGINQFADICHTLSRDNPSKLFLTGNFPSRLRKAWEKAGQFEVDITVTADGIKPVSRTIRFEWGGPWDSLKLPT
jgi:hypothetical protein